ncbi:hypothetical protein BDFB_011015 [Asbolus verrucosus]|uniref:DUF4817 domain-containing protein n=1 Tax=Asbolus verrucosus TaxID=1661398 RepID=A0A482VIY4_ASBVE|nr:hypothetical protein BDFB_011015 [Asbolus verrucosus]
MLLCFGEAVNNAAEASREYTRLYPNRRYPDTKVIRRVDQRLTENGKIMLFYVNR